MIPTISSIAEFDAALLTRYGESELNLSHFPVEERQRRFAFYEAMHLCWALIGALESEAAHRNDPQVLADGLSRFLKCAHAALGRPNEAGVHSMGYGYCTLVVFAPYSALLGAQYIAREFHADRPLSTYGYAAFRHAANLMVALENPGWKHTGKAEAAARKFVASKSATRVDAAFVATFLSTHEGNRDQASAALAQFADGYLKSDWGRRKPLTKGVFVRALGTYCGGKLGGDALASVDAMPDPPEGSAPRDRLRELRERALVREYQFPEPLQFLN